ncbi:hypothetical protein LGT39_14175 [Demequina sp. TTPB684]|uniref:hypothetical protein n=1 Tax=unclassified Demequina TaxID=2620311 RepID=UPI001CF1F9AF|nr:MULTISPECIES: hypothetical protein [unclassified Demequina]MCB2413994.1 hypothetical protein [Demequina sp. TTPB684]UPU88654.1 hypothetical protein LGT36_001655 [Demequina sp. TMPB413]
MSAERKDDAFALAARLDRQREVESAQASALVKQFAEQAKAAGIEPIRLTARPYSGRTVLKTDVVGWYIKRDCSVGVSTDGDFYLLHAPGGWSAWFKGVHLDPSDPPMELGRGARDGESMPMEKALAIRLAAGNVWP